MSQFEEQRKQEARDDEGEYYFHENGDRQYSEPLDSRPASPSYVQRHRQPHGTLPSTSRNASLSHEFSNSRSSRRTSPQPYTSTARQNASSSARLQVSAPRREKTYPGRIVSESLDSTPAGQPQSSPPSWIISEPWDEHLHSLEDEEIVRTITGIPAGVSVSLDNADSPSSGLKETKGYKQLVILAIWGSPRRRLTLQEIYDTMTRRFPVFASVGEHKAAWKQSIRHMLSLYRIFVPQKRPVTVPGKGGWWGLDLTQPINALKRTRKRNPGKGKAVDEGEGTGEVSDTESEPRKMEETEPRLWSPSSMSTQNEWVPAEHVSGSSRQLPPLGSWTGQAEWPHYSHLPSPQEHESQMGMSESSYSLLSPQADLFGAAAYGQTMPVYGQPRLPPLASSRYSPLPETGRVRRGAVSAASSRSTFSNEDAEQSPEAWTPASQDEFIE